MSKEKLKTREPYGSALWLDMLCYRTFAVSNVGCMSGALHIQPNDACNFQVVADLYYQKYNSEIYITNMLILLDKKQKFLCYLINPLHKRGMSQTLTAKKFINLINTYQSYKYQDSQYYFLNFKTVYQRSIRQSCKKLVFYASILQHKHFHFSLKGKSCNHMILSTGTGIAPFFRY